MQEERRRPGAGKRRGNLLSDQARFAHARHDDFALTLHEQIHRFGKLGIQPINQRLDGTRLDFEHTPPLGKAAQHLLGF